MELLNAKGTRDYAPEEKILRDRIFAKITAVFERYGFVPLETPILERYDVLSSKYTGGAEILKETFKLQDQGKRELGLRYDLTVPLSRFLAMNPQLRMPFKRYQIGPVFRDGPIEQGRVREFYQCDADIIGVKNEVADAECLNAALDAYKEIGLDVFIKVNNRKILQGIIEYSGEKKQQESVILTIDKLYKVGVEGVSKELRGKGIAQEVITKILEILSLQGTNDKKLTQLEKILPQNEGIQELQRLLHYVNNKKDLEFDVSLARGLAYYTGNIFEIVLRSKELGCSVGGGGRYDKMIGELAGNNKEYPAVGISFGFERIFGILKKDITQKTLCQIYVIPIKTFDKSLAIVQQLRDKKINCDVDLLQRNVGKNLEYASKLGIPYVLFIGEDELQQGKLKLRDMQSGTEELLKVEDVIKRLS